MDFTQPFRALTPTLDGPVLRVLARSDAPMTRRQITDLVSDASEAGVRKVLNRLVGQGLVIEERIGVHFTYVANRDHIIWPAVEIVVTSRKQLDDKIREHVLDWTVQPISIELFGSMATGESTSESDIDLMIYRGHLESDELEAWSEQIDELRSLVERWTGNVCEILEIDPPSLVQMAANDEPVLKSPTVTLVGTPAASVFGSSAATRHLAESLRAVSASVDMKDAAQSIAASGALRSMQQVSDQMPAIKPVMNPELRRSLDQFAKSMPTISPQLRRTLDEVAKSMPAISPQLRRTLDEIAKSAATARRHGGY